MNSPATQTQKDYRLDAAVPEWLKWSEVVVVTGLFLGLCFWANPEDPLYLNEHFPWPILGTLLVGLRYGFFAGLISALLALGFVGWFLQGHPDTDFPWVWSAGLLCTGLLGGEFRDYWSRKLQRAEAAHEYSLLRVKEFTRSFYLMKVSHDRLEQQLATSSGSLREALRRLYGELQAGSSRLNPENAGLMLQVLARYGQLQVAAIYSVKDGRIADTPMASIGDFGEVAGSDPLLENAIRQVELVSVQTEFHSHLDRLDTDLLAVVPLVASDGELIAVCAIKAIPFFHFHQKSLRLLAILAGHMADMVQIQQHCDTVGTSEWQYLCFQARRSARDAEQFNMPGILLNIRTSTRDAEPIHERMFGMRRGLDVLATNQSEKDVVDIVLLMPLTDELGLAGYLQRLDDDLRESLGHALNDYASVDSLMIRDSESVTHWLAKTGASHAE